jgi:hypothetical protein
VKLVPDTRRRRARFAALRVAALAALSVALVVLSGPRSEPSPPVAGLELVDGTFSHSNSRDGSAILTASGMRPGDSSTGTVTITNTGEVSGSLRLSGSMPLDTPGPGGGKLSERLQLEVEEISLAAAPTKIYAGTLDGLSSRALGELGAGRARSFRFTVSWPAVVGDDAHQGSSTSVEYSWHADEAPSTAPAPAPDPPQPPPGPALPAPSAPPAAAPIQIEPGPGRPPADMTAPSLRLSGPTTQRATTRGLVATARCDEPCTLRATVGVRLQRAGRLGVRRVGRLVTRRAAQAPVKLTVRLPRTALAGARRALARRRPVAATVTVTATDAAGNATSVTRRIALKR